MTIDEQRKIAYDQGRLAARRGQVHKLPAFEKDPDLMSHWQRGALEECDRMSIEVQEAHVHPWFPSEKANRRRFRL